MTDRTTLELLDAWYGGDKDALMELVRRHADWLRTNVRRRMSARMRLFETSEDVVQGVLLNLLKYNPPFRPANEQQFRALVARAVTNKLRDLHDLTTRTGPGPAAVEPLPSRESQICIPDKSSDRPDRRAEQHEERGFIAWAMNLIDPEDRRIIHWHDFERVEFAQIGERISMSEEGARSRYRRALARLRKQVEDLKRGRLDEMIAELEEDGSAAGAPVA